MQLNDDDVSEFERMIEFTFFTAHNQPKLCNLFTLIDSGSPISFIQKRFVEPFDYEILNPADHRYTGINNSPLEVIGIINCKIKFLVM